MSMKKKIIAAILFMAVAVLVWMRCTSPTAGTATETENVSAMLYNPHGSPAAHAKIKFYPRNYNPRTGGLGKAASSAVKIDSTTTDAHGNYKAVLDTGTYTILASGDSGLAYKDSIKVIKGDTAKPAADTLKPAGSIRGVIQLQPGDDARTVFILFMGTHTFTTPDDSFGNFTAPDLAEGKYRVRILTTLDNYAVMDTSLSAVAGKDSVLPGPIQLRFTGIPTPTGLRIAYDTLKQIVTLTWNRPTTGTKVQGYNVYRKNNDSTDFVKIKGGVSDMVYQDSTGVQDQTYEYRVAVVDTNGTEGTKSTGVSIKIYGVFAVVDSIVKGYTVNVDGNFGQMARGVLDRKNNFYIVDNTNKWLQKLDATGSFLFKVDTFSLPIAIANYADSALYVCDYDSRKIIKTDLLGNIDTIFSTIGRPGGICFRSDTAFISSDSGIEIYNLNGSRLDSIAFSFSVANSQPDIIAASNGNLYVVEDRGVFEANIGLKSINSRWSFPVADQAQQARMTLYNDSTILIAALNSSQQYIQSDFYLVSLKGNSIGRWQIKRAISGITISPQQRLICFSDGKILFLTK